MPFLRFKGFQKEFISSISNSIVQKFSMLTGVPQQKIKIELLLVEQIQHSPRSLEILMFPRDQKLHNQIAEGLNRLLSEHGFPDVHIFFILLSPFLYYKEGQPIAQQNEPVSLFAEPSN